MSLKRAVVSGLTTLVDSVKFGDFEDMKDGMILPVKSDEDLDRAPSKKGFPFPLDP